MRERNQLLPPRAERREAANQSFGRPGRARAADRAPSTGDIAQGDVEGLVCSTATVRAPSQERFFAGLSAGDSHASATERSYLERATRSGPASATLDIAATCGNPGNPARGHQIGACACIAATLLAVLFDAPYWLAALLREVLP